MSMSVKLVTFGPRANQWSLINGCYYTSSQGICMIIFEIDGCTQGGFNDKVHVYILLVNDIKRNTRTPVHVYINISNEYMPCCNE